MQEKEKKEIVEKLSILKSKTYSSDFWKNSQKAQEILKEIEFLNKKLKGGGKYDHLPSLVAIFSGVGGEDSEDFVKILFEMYLAFCNKNNFDLYVLDETKNSKGGYKNIHFEIKNKKSYGKLKKQNGVHRMIRKSPFNAKNKRQTSFALVEVLPKIPKTDFHFNEENLEISFSKSGGAGGQNVNKRDTAVRLTDPETEISVSVSSERSQEQNREITLELLRAKLFKKHREDEKKKKEGLQIDKKLKIDWGKQIRSYIFDPYKMVKNHKTGEEVNKLEEVLEGNLNIFEKEKK